MGSESSASCAIDSEAMGARGIIVLVKPKKPAIFATSGL